MSDSTPTDDATLLYDLCAVLADGARLALANRPTRSDRKAHQDHVTDVDMAVDAFLQQSLTRLLPQAPVLSEERATRVSGPVPAYWIVDPIDGTGNLVAGLPFVGISVALVDAAGPRVAAVASLFDATTFSAIRGGGSWRGTTGVGDPAPMRLPDQPSDLVVLSTGVLDALAARPQDAAQRWPAIRAVGKIRNLGAQSLHLCGVAAGQFAAAASIEARVWDEAAGGLILREAGGHWRSAADGADWAVPAEMMSIAAQRSLACHPGCRIALDAALAGLITR